MESINTNRGTFVKVARAHAPGGEGERWACEQVSPTLNTFDNGDSRSVVLITRRPTARNPDGCVNGSTAYGINVQNSNMFPFSRELSQVLSVTHLSGVVVYGVKYKQSEKSRKPYCEDIAQALSASCHDASVIMIGKGNANER